MKYFGLIAAFVLSGCVNSDPEDLILDPFENWNRSVFAFNEIVDEILFVPILSSYDKLIPSVIKNSIGNILRTVEEPISIVNSLLQFDIDKFLTHTARFIINATFGVAGIWDAAAAVNVVAEPEDFGTTLKMMAGVPPGYFLILPFIGPVTVRDAVGQTISYLIHPTAFIHVKSVALRSIYYPFRYFETLFDYKDAKSLTKENFSDPYSVIRGAYYEVRGDATSSDEDSFSAADSLEDKSDGEDDIFSMAKSLEDKSDGEDDIFSMAKSLEDKSDDEDDIFSTAKSLEDKSDGEDDIFSMAKSLEDKSDGEDDIFSTAKSLEN